MQLVNSLICFIERFVQTLQVKLQELVYYFWVTGYIVKTTLYTRNNRIYSLYSIGGFYKSIYYRVNESVTPCIILPRGLIATCGQYFGIKETAIMCRNVVLWLIIKPSQCTPRVRRITVRVLSIDCILFAHWYLLGNQ